MNACRISRYESKLQLSDRVQNAVCCARYTQNTVINKGIRLLIKTGDKTSYEHIWWTVPVWSTQSHIADSCVTLYGWIHAKQKLHMGTVQQTTWKKKRIWNKRWAEKTTNQKNRTKRRWKEEKNNYAIIDGKYPVIKTMKSILMQQIDTATWCKFFCGNSNLPGTQINQMRHQNASLSNNAIFQLGVNWTTTTATSTKKFLW